MDRQAFQCRLLVYPTLRATKISASTSTMTLSSPGFGVGSSVLDIIKGRMSAAKPKPAQERHPPERGFEHCEPSLTNGWRPLILSNVARPQFENLTLIS